MAFCEKCGKEIGPDGVCGCQKIQPSSTAQTSNGGAAPKTVQDMLKDKKIVMVAAAAAAAVLLLIVIIGAIAGGGGGYKKPVKELVNLINKQSTDVFAYQKLVNPMSGNMQNMYNILKKNADVKEELDQSKEDLKEFYEDIKGFKITKCDFVKAKEMSNKDLRAIQKSAYNSDLYEDIIETLQDMDAGDYEDMADELDISKGDAKKLVKEMINMYKVTGKAKVTKGYEVTLRFYAKYDKDEDKTEKIEDVQVLKVNGNWYVDVKNLLRNMSFDDELDDVDLYTIYRIMNRLSLPSF